MNNLDPDALVDRFLAGAITAPDFKHDMHVAVAWALLKRMPYLEALTRCVATIKAMAERQGAPHKFNMTITTAFMALIDEHMRATPQATWSEFVAANPKVLDRKLLERWYAPERLRSREARETFLMPRPCP